MKIIELHILQSFGPNVLNGDDVGDPKSCLFGGVRRARISSQSFKFAIRHGQAYRERANSTLAPRTRQLMEALRSAAAHHALTGDDNRYFAGVLDAIFGADKDGQLKSTLILSEQEIASVASAAAERLKEWRTIPEGKKYDDDRKAIYTAVAQKVSPNKSHPDVALFGRFLASDRDWDVQSATQYSHAVSVHRSDIDLDFFTAYDDVEQQSSHLGHQGFNAPTYYRYAALDVDQLCRNLDGEIEISVDAWLHGTVLSIPGGKQNSFAAFNAPDFVLAQVRDGMQRNLLGAFEVPVRAEAGGTGILGMAIDRLFEYGATLDAAYGQGGLQFSGALSTRDLAKHGIKPQSLEELSRGILGAL